MIRTTLSILLFCAYSAFGQQWLIVFEGGSAGNAVTVADLIASTHGPTTVADNWQVSASATGMTYNASAQKSLLGPVTLLNGFGTYSGSGTLGLRSLYDSGGQYIIFYPRGSTRPTTGIVAVAVSLFYTDLPVTNSGGPWDVWTITGYNGGGNTNDFVNMQVSGAGTDLVWQMETGQAPSPAATVHTATSNWLVLAIAYNIGSTNGHIFQIYDYASRALLGEVFKNYDTGNPAWFVDWGVTDNPGSSTNANGHFVYHDNLLIDFSGSPTWPPPLGSLSITSRSGTGRAIGRRIR